MSSKQDPNAPAVGEDILVYTQEERNEYAQNLLDSVLAKEKAKIEKQVTSDLRAQLEAEIRAELTPAPTPTPPQPIPTEIKQPDESAELLKQALQRLEQIEKAETERQAQLQQRARQDVIKDVASRHKTEYQTPLWDDFLVIVKGDTEDEIEESVKALIQKQTELEKATAEKLKKPTPPPTHGGTHNLPPNPNADVPSVKDQAKLLADYGITHNIRVED